MNRTRWIRMPVRLVPGLRPTTVTSMSPTIGPVRPQCSAAAYPHRNAPGLHAASAAARSVIRWAASGGSSRYTPRWIRYRRPFATRWATARRDRPASSSWGQVTIRCWLAARRMTARSTAAPPCAVPVHGASPCVSGATRAAERTSFVHGASRRSAHAGDVASCTRSGPLTLTQSAQPPEPTPSLRRFVLRTPPVRAAKADAETREGRRRSPRRPAPKPSKAGTEARGDRHRGLRRPPPTARAPWR
jgi:hypothetical protein